MHRSDFYKLSLIFQISCVIQTGLLDFHEMVVKTSYRKTQPKIINYRNHKNFSNDIFRETLQKIFPQNLANKSLLFHDFFFICIFASYAQDNTPYVVANNLEDVIISLQNPKGFRIIK